MDGYAGASERFDRRRQTAYRTIIELLIEAGAPLMTLDDLGRLPPSLLRGTAWPELRDAITTAIEEAPAESDEKWAWLKPRGTYFEDSPCARGFEWKPRKIGHVDVRHA